MDTIQPPSGIESTLWYRDPASGPLEALPLGNGRLGALVTGDPACEEIIINEETLWAGDGTPRQNPSAAEHVDEVRELIFDGRHGEAQELADRHLMGEPIKLRPYQRVGTLTLSIGDGDVDDYCQELNLETAIATTRYETDRVTPFRSRCQNTFFRLRDSGTTQRAHPASHSSYGAVSADTLTPHSLPFSVR